MIFKILNAFFMSKRLDQDSLRFKASRDIDPSNFFKR